MSGFFFGNGSNREKAGTFGSCPRLASASQETGGFYVVRDSSTKKCTIVDTKPTTTTTTVVDNGTFKTRTEAETGMKTMKVCTN